MIDKYHWFLDKGVSEGSYACMAQTEGLSTYNGKLLVLYESGATKYRGDAVNPTDHVWAVTFPSNEE